MNTETEPRAGQIWEHKKNLRSYIITGIKNQGNSDYDDNNPPIVCYMDGDGNEYARYRKHWQGSFSYKGLL